MLFTRKGAIIFVVVLGATMSISSVFLYNQIIGKNYSKIQKLEGFVMEKEELIKDLWQNTLALEGKQDTLLLMILLNKDKGEFLSNYIKRTMKVAGIPTEGMLSNDTQEIFATVASQIEEKREKSQELINDAYLEKLSKQDEISKLKHENDKFAMFALLLQVVGLMLILSKDIIRQ